MSDLKKALRDTAESILKELPEREFAADMPTDNWLWSKLLDIAEGAWRAGCVAGADGVPVYENPYSVLTEADRAFIRAAAALPSSENLFTQPLFPKLHLDIANAREILQDSQIPRLGERYDGFRTPHETEVTRKQLLTEAAALLAEVAPNLTLLEAYRAVRRKELHPGSFFATRIQEIVFLLGGEAALQ